MDHLTRQPNFSTFYRIFKQCFLFFQLISPNLGKYLEKFKQNGDVSLTFLFFLLMGEDC